MQVVHEATHVNLVADAIATPSSLKLTSCMFSKCFFLKLLMKNSAVVS